MANMIAILNDLTTEIRLAVCAIDPNDKATEKFRSPKALQKENIREQPGTPRLFEVTWSTPVALDTGHSKEGWRVLGSITIGYPIQTDWNVTRAGDVHQIFSALNVADGVTGCDAREIPEDEEIEIEEAEDDWLWMIVPLRAFITTE